MTTNASDLVYAATKYYGATGVATYQGLTKREYAAAVILNGLLRDADNVGVLSDAALATIAVARADAALTAAGATGTDLAFPPEEFRKVSLPAAARKTGITKLEEYCINLMSGFQGDNLSIDALNPSPGALTDALAGLGVGLVEHITVPAALTAALAAVPIAGNVNLLTVPIAPSAALAGVGAGSVDHIAVPIAPTMVEGAAGLVDVGSHWYVITYNTADGQTLMGAISAEIAIAGAAKHVTVTIPVSPFVGVVSRFIYRSKIAGAHVVAADFFRVGSVGDNTTVTFDDNLAEAGMPATNPPATSTAAGYKYIVAFVAEDGTETTMGAIQAAKITMEDNTANGKITVTIPVSAEAGVAQRKIYRCKAGMTTTATLRTHFFLVGTVANNTDVSFLDNIAEAAVGASPPAANGTGGHKYIVTHVTADGETTMGAISSVVTVTDPSVNGQVELTGIPVSTQVGVTQRKVYRSKAGVVPTLRTHFFLLGTIANNTGTTLTDNTADSGLGANPPAANSAANYTYKVTHGSASGESEAGAASGGVVVADKAANGKVALSVIPTGPTGTLWRKIYRTKAGKGSVGPWYYHSTITGNITTTATDNTPDSGLGATTAPSADTAWAGILGVDIADKAAKLVTQMGSSANDPVIPYRWYVASGAEVRQGLTKEEFFAEAAESGFISDSVNIGVFTNAQLATKGDTLSAALIVALN